MITKSLFGEKLFQNFDSLKKESLSKIKNFSEIDNLPIKKTFVQNKKDYQMFEEKIDIKKIDYYFSNAIARSSKTMGDCKQARELRAKNGVGS